MEILTSFRLAGSVCVCLASGHAPEDIKASRPVTWAPGLCLSRFGSSLTFGPPFPSPGPLLTGRGAPPAQASGSQQHLPTALAITEPQAPHQVTMSNSGCSWPGASLCDTRHTPTAALRGAGGFRFEHVTVEARAEPRVCLWSHSQREAARTQVPAQPFPSCWFRLLPFLQELSPELTL